jgi:hypothetical protein
VRCGGIPKYLLWRGKEIADTTVFTTADEARKRAAELEESTHE